VISPVQDDIIYAHFAAEGEIDGRLRHQKFVHGYRPIEVAGARQTAIAWTAAGSMFAMIKMVRAGALPERGGLKQEDFPLGAFLKTENHGLLTRRNE